MDQEKLGKFLLQLRKNKHLTQKEVAQQIGVTSQAVSKWECGHGIPDIENLAIISKTFNVDIVELYKGAGCFQEDINNHEKKSKEKVEEEIKEEYNDVLKDTINQSSNKLNKGKLKLSILWLILAIIIYSISLTLDIPWLNSILFILATLIVIYLLDYPFKKMSHIKKYIITIIIIIFIIIGYIFLEKVFIVNKFRQPIFSIKEIYKEYNLTLYNSFFYKAYSCDSTKKNISILENYNKEIEKICTQREQHNSTDKLTLKSGAIITLEQKIVLENFQVQLANKGFVDFNYMRQEDLNNFFKYLDDTIYCGTYETNEINKKNLVVKRKNGICQYNNENYYYCSNTNKDGKIEYKKAKNKQCS